MDNIWKPDSYLSYEKYKQPIYSNLSDLDIVISKLKEKEPISDVDRIIDLKIALSDPNAFIIQLGDCAEPILKKNEEIEIYGQSIEILINEVAKILKNNNDHIKPIKIARAAGQFAKPRTHNFETQDDQTLPAYFGDAINGYNFSYETRNPDPYRMISAYYYAKTLYKLHYDFFCSHEALLLPYEFGLIRHHKNISYYAGSGDFLWIGNRTRFMGSAHIEILRGIYNPIGIKLGPEINIKELLSIISILNPENEPGRISIICRFGIKHVDLKLRILLEHIIQEKCNILLVCDPMHGNGYIDHNNIKRRKLDDIIQEITIFQKICCEFSFKFSGIHLEASFEKDILECVDNESRTSGKYTSLCDPRLNYTQLKKVIESIEIPEV